MKNCRSSDTIKCTQHSTTGSLLPSNAEQFVKRWQQSSASERANYALFLSELCDFLDLPRPEPSQADYLANTYV